MWRLAPSWAIPPPSVIRPLTTSCLGLTSAGTPSAPTSSSITRARTSWRSLTWPTSRKVKELPMSIGSSWSQTTRPTWKSMARRSMRDLWRRTGSYWPPRRSKTLRTRSPATGLMTPWWMIRRQEGGRSFFNARTRSFANEGSLFISQFSSVSGFLGVWVSWFLGLFLGFRVSWFHGFWVSWFLGILVSGSPRFSWFSRFLACGVSCFCFKSDPMVSIFYALILVSLRFRRCFVGVVKIII